MNSLPASELFADNNFPDRNTLPGPLAHIEANVLATIAKITHRLSSSALEICGIILLLGILYSIIC